jgi:hypothetical protein
MAGTATTLAGRLLCASGCAYSAVAGEAALDPEAALPYYTGVGWAAPPAAFLAGTDDINACVVGTCDDGVVVAFRGTLPLDGPFNLPKLLDWVNDINAAPVAGAGLPGLVHRGFLGSLDSLWPAVRDQAKRRLTLAGPAAGLLVTGHSKGGAVAALAAMRFKAEVGLTPRVVTFAAPKAGNTAFASAYNAAVLDHTRYEYAEDIVPHLPPSAAFLGVLSNLSFLSRRLPDLTQFDYARVGGLRYIRRSGEVVAGPDETFLSGRRQRLLELALGGHVQQIGDDHRIACGYGYMTALCPTGVCPAPLGPTG